MIEFCVFVSDFNIFSHIDKALTIISKPQGDKYAALSLNEKVNQQSLEKLTTYFQKSGFDFKLMYNRIYFGNETCERLIPDTDELEKVYTQLTGQGIPLTYVTPYTGPDGIKKIEQNLHYLNAFNDIEVVFNDWGVLHLIEKKFPNLEPVFGRLMIKSKRDPRFSESPYSIHPYKIEKLDKVARKQVESIIGNSLEIPGYTEFLSGKGIGRAGFETLPSESEDIKKQFKKNTSGMQFDLYWPWTYISSGRNCQIAAYTQPAGKIHPAGKKCYYQCRDYEFGFSSDKQMLESVQRGNAIWMNTTKMLMEYIKYDFDRLVYQPYIPV
jgi:hypothetical protein